jgi:hypothetical protein
LSKKQLINEILHKELEFKQKLEETKLSFHEKTKDTLKQLSDGYKQKLEIEFRKIDNEAEELKQSLNQEEIVKSQKFSDFLNELDKKIKHNHEEAVSNVIEYLM